MDVNRFNTVSRSFAGRGLTRRQALVRGGVGLAAAGLAAARGRGSTAQEGSATPDALTSSDAGFSEEIVSGLEADILAALETFKVPGAAVALVQGDRIVYTGGFGIADLERGVPVTEPTRFRIGSNTKSMSALLAATYVDEGVFDWDSRVVDVWPEFVAPTAELTAALRVRDLMGMGTGIAEPSTIEFFLSGGGASARDMLGSISDLPVTAPFDTAYAYNNTLVCAAAYLGPLALGAAPETLDEAYAEAMRERVFAPIGMADAAIADDPRPLGDDYAAGHTFDVFGRPAPVPFVSIGGAAPAGAGLASAVDMARYLITQMNGGVSPDGTRVASAASLDETHRPGVIVPPDATNALPSLLLPDTSEMRYCLGWFDQTFTDGRHLLWHGGGIDGFASLMGFFPAEKLGFVILTNLEPGRGGFLLNFAVQSNLLKNLFGYNRDISQILTEAAPQIEAQTAELAARTVPVDMEAVAPYLGLYGGGFTLRLDADGGLRLDHDIRSMAILGLADGGYLVTDGPGAIQGHTIAFTTGGDGVPSMQISGFDPVRWLTGA